MPTHSGGPKTPRGRARSRLNALKHGLRATDDLFLYQLNRRERRTFEHFRTSLHEEYAPQSAQEKLIVDRIAIQHFRLFRLYNLEYVATRKSRHDPLSRESIIPHLDRFSRYDWRIERQISVLHNRLRMLYTKRQNFSLISFQTKE